jgi:5-methylcytosine-specific restriction endonuclease McrA
VKTPEELRAYNAAKARAHYARNRDKIALRLKERRAANPEKYRARDKQARERSADARRASARARYQRNIKKNRAQDAVFREANKDRLAARRKERYATSPKTAEAFRARSRAWYAKNAAVVAPKKRAAAKAWRIANPDRARENGRNAVAKRPEHYRAMREASLAKRRAREHGARVGDRAAYKRYMLWARNVAVADCRWCGKETTPRHRHIDHIIPLSKGGADAVANLCIACPRCNRSKAAKLPEEFAGQSELRLA